MKRLDKLCTSNLAAWAFITLVLAFTLASPYLPHTVLHAQSVGHGGVPGSGTGAAVSSVFGRTGAVVAASGDYTAAQVTNAAATNAGNTFTADQETSGSNIGFAMHDTTFGQTDYLLNYVGAMEFLNPSAFSGSWAAFYSYGFTFAPALTVGWSENSGELTNGADTAFSRISPGVLALGNGAASSTTGELELATVAANTTVSTPAISASALYSAAGTALPTCASGLNGERAVVSDATSPTYMAAYASGGGITAEVICSYSASASTYSWLTH